MKYTININQFALFTAGLVGKVDYSDIAILEYLKDFVYYKNRKSLYINGEEHIWLNYHHLISSLPFADFKSKAPVSKRIIKLKNLGLIRTYQAKDNTLYYTFTDKMIELLFTKTQFKPQNARKDRSSHQKVNFLTPSTVSTASAVKNIKPQVNTGEHRNSNNVGQGFSLAKKQTRHNVGQGFSLAKKQTRSVDGAKRHQPKGLPYENTVKEESGDFNTMSSGVWKVVSQIRERQIRTQNSNVKTQNHN